MMLVTHYHSMLHERFKALFEVLFNLDANTHLIVHIYHTKVPTFEVQMRQYMKSIAEDHTNPAREMIIQFRSVRMICRHTNKTSIIKSRHATEHKFLHIDFSAKTGEVSNTYTSDSVSFSEPFVEALDEEDSDVSLRKPQICAKAPYTEETFLAACVLKQHNILTSPIVFTDIEYQKLPPHDKFTNIIVIEDSPTSIAIL